MNWSGLFEGGWIAPRLLTALVFAAKHPLSNRSKWETFSVVGPTCEDYLDYVHPDLSFGR